MSRNKGIALEDLVTLRRSGLSFAEIGREVGISRGVVCRRLATEEEKLFEAKALGLWTRGLGLWCVANFLRVDEDEAREWLSERGVCV